MKFASVFVVSTTFLLMLTDTFGGPFLQDSGTQGLVSIEVENFDQNIPVGSHSWDPVSSPVPGFSGAGVLQALPNTGVNNNTGYSTTSPRLDFDIEFLRVGIHYVWLRGLQGPGGGRDDSVHVGLDSVETDTSDRISSFNSNWTWTRSTMDGAAATINVTTPGLHTVNIWMREDGTIIDKIVLVTDSSYTPTGSGPPESATAAVAGADLVPQLTGFPRVSEEEWDEVAVRKVLRTFAYGGQALDSQITAWADMPPAQAIAEMLTFDEHNLKLSPVGPADTDRLDTRDGTLLGLSQFWTSGDPANGVYPSIRHIYGQQNPHLVWTKAATSRGLNPFRQKIGLWETNYHMATNIDAGVPRNLMFGYYDAIMKALEQGLPYQDVLTVAATSPAVATQYGHRYNVFVNGECLCNEDFAREYHQLFFGILGDYNPDLHEAVSIKNTAAALTDMKVQPDGQGGLLNSITYGTGYHFPGLLQILDVDIGGVNAFDRINELSQYAIAHPESLANLPVIIIRGLADDNLTDSKIQAIRTAWASLPEKNLLDFLRAYAISTLFHDESRIKYWTSIDRHVLIANQVTLNNEEGYLNLYDPGGFEDEDVQPFHPRHNVFGGQTGTEAADSSGVFRNNYNRMTEEEVRYRRAATQKYGRTWEKDWGAVIPQVQGVYQVGAVAEWLWNRFIGDGLKHFGDLERLHVHALLARGRDIAYVLDPDDPDRVVTELDLNADADLQSLLANLGNELMALNSADASERLDANENIGQAINFIVGMPYMFLDEGT